MPDTAIPDRTRRALKEIISILPDTGRARNAPGLVLAVSESGSEYLVDVEENRCECPDSLYNVEECKHIRRAKVAMGRRPVTSATLRACDVDPDLGQHVDAEPTVIASDGVVGDKVTSAEESPSADPAEA